MDTRWYEVEVPDGTVKEYTEHIIAESSYLQVNSKVNEWVILDEINEYHKEISDLSEDETLISPNGAGK